jgi:flagellar protein FlgJ
VARQLEGVFVAQLYQAMRASVPRQEGIVSGGTGEEMFTALMDQHLAAETPEHWASGLADAIHRQLRGRALAGLPDDPAGAATAIAAPAPTPDPIAAR